VLRPTRLLACLALSGLVAGILLAPPGAAWSATVSPADASPAGASPADARAALSKYRHPCSAPARRGRAQCLALVRTTKSTVTAVAPAVDPPPTDGYGPSDLQRAYNLTASSASAGSGATVAIVDAYDDPNAESDLGVYRTRYGLSACTTANGCFHKINQRGGSVNYPDADSGWSAEISLDVDMVSAICPRCHILLVEADSNDDDDLGAGVDEAVAQGAKFVSNSYGESEGNFSTLDNHYYDHTGVAITASTGDSGYGVSYPAVVPTVTAVAGTTLFPAASTRGWAEIAWVGAGSGCSSWVDKPSWQKDYVCPQRTVGDVSAIADPDPGVAVYDTYNTQEQGFTAGWNPFGGTSASSPIIASVYALAGTPAADTFPVTYLYRHPGGFTDITAGTNNPAGTCVPDYLCHAEAGYDGPTGWGVPNGVASFRN
jgi:subtilase family serine protease